MPVLTDNQALVAASAKLTLYRSNFELFAKRELKTKTKYQTLLPLKLRRFQHDLWYKCQRQLRREGHIRQLWLKSRQIGATTLAQAIMFWRTALNPYVNSLVVAHDNEIVEEVFKKAHTFYEKLSPDIRPMVRYSTRRELIFDNPDDKTRTLNPGLESSFVVSTARNLHSGAGRTLHNVHLSEAARYPNAQEVESSTFPAVPVGNNSIIIAESTARPEGDWFHEQCKAAVEGRSPFEFNFIGWNKDPDAQLALSPDEELDPDATERELMHDFTLSPEQIKFMRYKIAEFRGDMDKWHQEYPICVAGETRVSTELGIIPVTEALECRETESGEILKAGPQPESPIIKITTRAGRVLRATPDHPVHTPSGAFVWMINLKPGDTISLRPPRFSDSIQTINWNEIPGITKSVTIDEEWARFLGYFCGDGSWYSTSIHMACDAQDLDVIEELRRLMAVITGGTPQLRSLSVGGVELRLGCEPLRDALSSIGVIDYVKEDQHWKRAVRVPECIFRSPKHIVAQFLRYLFEADGSASHGIVRLGASKLEFLRDVQLVLLGFGITSAISANHKFNSDGSIKHSFWALRLSKLESLLFNEEIGFVGIRKSSTISDVKRLASCAPIVLEDEVVDVELDGSEVVYDFTVKDVHVFSANGILTHNTPDECWLKPGFLVWPMVQLDLLRKGVCAPKERGEIAFGAKFLHTGDGPLAIWAHPAEGEMYDIGADVALGVGAHKSVAQVLKRSTSEQVASFASRSIEPGEYADMLYWLGFYYNTAQIAVEVNNMGLLTNARLSEKYPNTYRWRMRDKTTPHLTQKTGWSTSTHSKRYMVSLGKDRVYRYCTSDQRERFPLIRCEQLHQQMRTFVREEDAERVHAAPGCEDDHVMAWLIALVANDDESFTGSGAGRGDEEQPAARSAFRDPATYIGELEHAARFGDDAHNAPFDFARGWS